MPVHYKALPANGLSAFDTAECGLLSFRLDPDGQLSPLGLRAASVLVVLLRLQGLS